MLIILILVGKKTTFKWISITIVPLVGSYSTIRFIHQNYSLGPKTRFSWKDEVYSLESWSRLESVERKSKLKKRHTRKKIKPCTNEAIKIHVLQGGRKQNSDMSVSRIFQLVLKLLCWKGKPMIKIKTKNEPKKKKMSNW